MPPQRGQCPALTPGWGNALSCEGGFSSPSSEIYLKPLLGWDQSLPQIWVQPKCSQKVQWFRDRCCLCGTGCFPPSLQDPCKSQRC